MPALGLSPPTGVGRPAGTDPLRRTVVTTRLASTSTVVITAHGEMDAANAAAVFSCIENAADSYAHLIVDLSDIRFFGTAGFFALHRINVGCNRRGITWRLVAGREVRRLLRLCDPEGGLPGADSVESAVTALRDLARGHLRLLDEAPIENPA